MISPAKLISAKTNTGAVAGVSIPVSKKTFQGSVAGTGAVTATINIEGSNDNTLWEVLGTITLTGTTVAHDSFVSDAPWIYTRGNITAISGTGAAVTLNAGFQL